MSEEILTSLESIYTRTTLLDIEAEPTRGHYGRTFVLASNFHGLGQSP
ncbi:MAG: hypothetical protein ACI81L_001636 [Verrucomicrobiales bacterium]|jgi:hypothetical protein